MHPSKAQDDAPLRFPDEAAVEVKFPLTPEQEKADRATWPWLPGTILEQVGADEWLVCVEARELATLADGSPAHDGTPDEELLYPCCYRDGGEIPLAGGAR